MGLYLSYRKNKARDFVGHPSQDLRRLKNDFELIYTHRKGPFIVASDLNDEHHVIPAPLSELGANGTRLVDPFAGMSPKTFEQDWLSRRQFTLDYLYLSESLAGRVVSKRGGITDFPTAFGISDHAPLLVEAKI